MLKQFILEGTTIREALQNKYMFLHGETEINQYTGLKDKNGKEIYEGDIVNVHHFDPMGNDIRYIGLVQFSVYGGAQIVRPNGEFDFVREYEYGRHEESLEIIGDIYKYPDLLSQ